MLRDYLRAGYPALALLTQEPTRALRVIEDTTPDTWRVLAWDCLSGMKDVRAQTTINDTTDPVEAMRVLDSARDTVLVTQNLHLFLDSPEVIQALQSGSERWKAMGSCLVMVAPVFPVSFELEKVFTLVDLPLPGQFELEAMQQELATSTGAEMNSHAVEAARGLTEAEAEAAFAMCLVREGRFAPEVIADLKSNMLRKSGLLEAWEPAAIDEVGGLDGLKGFIGNRTLSLRDHDSNLPRLKSLLLVGVPGCGKSLTCKAVSSMLGWPLLRLDLGNLKGSLVGESERRMREALRIIEAFGQAVVFVDELEKGFAGSRSNGSSDGGVMANLSGTWLTWMQETTAPVLVMATANGVQDLPPEMLRAGRWDGLFFVDLPSRTERCEILAIMNRRYGTDIPLEAADLLDGYSGAEIEQLVKDSLFDGWDAAVSFLVPLSRTMKEELDTLRSWARARARAANTQDPTETGRQVRPN
ncbi:MAG: AAA family ATPase [Oceanidesulfovibrio sp.]